MGRLITIFKGCKMMKDCLKELKSKEDTIDKEDFNETNSRNNGGVTDYYRLLDTVYHLEDLIADKGMPHSLGEAFCAIYRWKDKDTIERNLYKAKHNIEQMLSMLQEGKLARYKEG